MGFISCLFLASAALASAETYSPEPARQLVRSIYAELIGSNTSYSTGQSTPAAEAMAGDDKAQAAIWVANLIRYKQEASGPRATSSSPSPRTRGAGGPTTARVTLVETMPR